MGPGRVLGGRYRVMSQVGSGGFGHAWTAYDDALQVEVMVEKVGAADSEGTARATRALRVVAGLRDHPNIIPVSDILETNGAVWTVMPLVSGPSLADYLVERGRASAERAREVAEALLDALEAMQEAGFVHEDVRPANIHFHKGRWALLPGIGALAANDAETGNGRTIAEVDYIAPESLQGATKGPQSALFSLGATLYHLVAGRAPFRRDSLFATLSAVMLDEPPPLGDIGELGRLIEGLLDKDPETRLTVASARRMIGRAGGEPHVVGAPMKDRPATTAVNSPSARHAGSVAVYGLPLVVVALVSTPAHISAADVSGFSVDLMPWALFALGLSVLAIQVRAALARQRARERVPVWRSYVQSLAPPTPWTDEERGRRRAAAERAVDEALLTVDRRLADISPGRGGDRGATDV